jgi:arsenate reductase-like glutaredoxin family protein
MFAMSFSRAGSNWIPTPGATEILPQWRRMQGVQIFGVRNCQASRAAERFFKERRIAIHYVDLKQRPLAPGEIKRFLDRFGWEGILDTEGKIYADAGLKYLKVSGAEMLARCEREPRLLLLPLVRAGHLVSAGRNEDAWQAMATTPSR